MFLSLIFIVYFVHSYFTKTVLAEKKNYNNYVVHDITYSISNIISNINNVSISIISDKAINTYFVSDKNINDPAYLSLYTNALSALQTLSLREPFIHDIYLFQDRKRSIHSGINSRNAFFTAEEIEIMDKSIGGWFWSYNDGTLSLCRVIRNIDNLKENIAYSKIVINTSELDKLLGFDNVLDDMRFALLDMDRKVLFHNLDDASLWLLDKIDGNDELLQEYNWDSFYVSNGNSSYNVFPQQLRRQKSYLVAFAVDKTNEYNQLLYRIILYLILVFVLLFSIQTLVYNHFFIKPITVLGNLMKSIESEDFSVRFNMKVSEEIETLTGKFNLMSSKLQYLYDEVYRKSLKLKEAEIKNLQSEINPHFLYNILDSICWMIELRQTENAVQMVRNLSSLFRLSLYRTSDGLILLKDELEHAKCYVGIQQLRFVKIKFHLDIQQGLENTYVMKLVLQPILENAIIHGLAPGGGQGEIILAVYQQDNDIIYYIYDSGVGVDLDKVREILRGKDISTGTEGLALNNVNERLKLRFGENYGISCYRPSGGGSVFIVKQPIIYNKGEIND
jgi:two-component system sensor histidine kinase YesM